MFYGVIIKYGGRLNHLRGDRRTVEGFKILFIFFVLQGSFQNTPNVDKIGNVRIGVLISP